MGGDETKREWPEREDAKEVGEREGAGKEVR